MDAIRPEETTGSPHLGSTAAAAALANHHF